MLYCRIAPNAIYPHRREEWAYEAPREMQATHGMDHDGSALVDCADVQAAEILSPTKRQFTRLSSTALIWAGLRFS